MNLDDSVSFNEKLQWLKLYDKNPNYTYGQLLNEIEKWNANKK